MPFEQLSEDHVPASKEVYLDTSIHCSRLKGTLFTERIRRVASLFDWMGTSTYTKIEYGNVVLARAEYYLRKLDEFDSLEQALSFIGNVLPHTFHGASVTWSFNLLSNVKGATDAERTERAKLSLRRLLKLGLKFVEGQCDQPLCDGTSCYWAKRDVTKKRDGTIVWKTPRCDREVKRCKLDEFFASNQEVFEKIAAAIESMPTDKKSKQLEEFVSVIKMATDDPTTLLDYKSGCKKLADAIIAVDGMDYKSVFSQNVAESEMLTQILEQDFYYLPPNPEHGVKVAPSTQ